MPGLTPAALLSLAQTEARAIPDQPPVPRPISIWEITQWILPMAPEHLRRVLAAHHELPQGTGAVEGGTRWFVPADLAALRRHFARPGPKARHLPPRPEGVRAPLVVLTQPQGRMGRSFAARHLAVAAALAGWRVLRIAADPSEVEAGAADLAQGLGVAGLIGRDAARHLQRLNRARLDRGEAPLALEAGLAAALDLRVSDLIRPSLWPGLDLMPAAPALFQADGQIGAWRMALRGWQPWGALATALDAEGLRQSYDLILCDPPRGLGPLALTMLMSADVLLVPLPLREAGNWAAGLAALAAAAEAVQAEAQALAQALGQKAPALPWQRVAVLPVRGGPGADRGGSMPPSALASGLPDGFQLLPNALPELGTGTTGQFYDLDYRDIGKLAYSPQRDGVEAAWRGLAGLIAGLWAAEAAAASATAL